MTSSKLAFLAAFSVHLSGWASPVTFSGGFSSFVGAVATASGSLAQSVYTEINGVTVYADGPLPGGKFGFDNYGLGLSTRSLLIAGQPVPTVNFSRVFFSQPHPNSITFTPNTQLDLSVGQSFRIGTFTMSNGAWWGNSPGNTSYPDTDFGFSVTTHSSDPALNGFTFSDTVRFVVTAASQAGATREDDADIFYFVDRRDLGSMRVYESVDPSGGGSYANTGSIDLIVRIGSLVPVALDNAQGGAFVGAAIPAVPEPHSAALLSLGLIATATLVIRRRR